MKFLIILVLFLFLGILTGLYIFRFLFGSFFRSSRQNQQSANKQTYNQQGQSAKKQKKIIDSNEGEYIDYEEVKD